MGRYDLRLRSIYGQDEATGGELFQRGIGTAIAEHEKEVGEDNARRAAGQVKVRETGVMDRLKNAGRRIQGAARGIAGMIHPDEPEALPSMSSQPPMSPAEVNANIARSTPPIARPAENVAAPGLTPSYAGGVEAQAVKATRPSIADAIQPYEEQDAHGNTWKVDPLYQAKVAEAGQELGTDRRLREITARDHSLDVEERARLIREKAAQDRMTQEQKDAANAQRNADRIAAQERIAELRRRYGPNSPEVQKEILELRRRGLDLQERRLDQQEEGGYVRTEQGAARMDYGRGRASAMDQAMETPEQKAQREKANRSGDAHAKNVTTVQQRRANSMATKEQAAARARALQAQHLTPEQIKAKMRDEGFKVQ